jgi:hypothetical protein
MILDSFQSANGVNPRAETPENEGTGPWGECEILLVADRTHGSTHTFFHDWRFEVVMGAGHPEPGTTLFAVQLALRELATSGRRYDVVLLEERPEPLCRGGTVFSWQATSVPGTPDPLAAALEQARTWLAAGGWQQGPSTSTGYAKPGRSEVTSRVRAEDVVGTTDQGADPAALTPQLGSDLAEPAGVQGWETEGGAVARDSTKTTGRRWAS